MKKTKLVLGTHNSLPPGTREDEFERAYQQAYKPFLTTVYRFPEVLVTLQYSGVLLEWLQERHPEFLMLLNDMVKRKQVELLGGAFYEPILALIPNRDRSGQIEMLTTYLRRRFGRRPRGFWVPELVWEPSLPVSIRNNGMEFVFLAQQHFLSAGMRGEDLYKPCITEDQGKSLVVFPLTDEITLGEGGESPSGAVNRIHGLVSDHDTQIVSIIVDGESMGLWDSSHELFYEKNWLPDFLQELCDSREMIATSLPGDMQRSVGPVRKCYFQCTSYEEMMQWSLSLPQQKEFVKIRNSKLSRARKSFLMGGHFRHFLSKYPEANLLYSKMMHVHILVNQIRGDKYRRKAAREELWKGEAHNGYWHGKTGGIYRNNVRKTGYTALLEAEKATRERGIFKPHISEEDFDQDGVAEYLCNGNRINLYFHRIGGVAFELDYLPRSWNYLDTMSRHEEIYHESLDRRLVHDLYPRRAFVDHFFDAKTTIEQFHSMAFKEQGSFISEDYGKAEFKRDHMELTLTADGRVNCGETLLPVRVVKSISLNGDRFTVSYDIVNLGESRLKTIFGSEINLSFASDCDECLQLQARKGKEDGDGEAKVVQAPFMVESVSDFTAFDRRNAVRISVAVSQNAELWVAPVHAVWVSRMGVESGYESTCFLPRWPLDLEPGGSFCVDVQTEFTAEKV